MGRWQGAIGLAVLVPQATRLCWLEYPDINRRMTLVSRLIKGYQCAACRGLITPARVKAKSLFGPLQFVCPYCKADLEVQSKKPTVQAVKKFIASSIALIVVTTIGFFITFYVGLFIFFVGVLALQDFGRNLTAMQGGFLNTKLVPTGG